MSSNNRISDLINSQIPFFVRNSHPTFVAFLESYYEYLEQEGKAVNVSENLLNYRDVDETLDEFSKKLYTTFLEALPKDANVDKDLVIKNIKDFYRARGTEKSVKFLMRIISGEETELYYPKLDVLKASDGKWYIQKSIRVSNTSINGTTNTALTGLELFVNREVRGNTSNAYAIVDRVDRFYEQGVLVDELVLSRVSGTFTSGEKIFTNYTDSTGTFIQANTFIMAGSVESIRIVDVGSGYEVSDPLTFESETGTGARAIVSRVSTGNIANITLTYGGAGFLANDSILVSGGGGTGANARVLQVNTAGYHHPAYYNVYTTLVQDMGGTVIMSPGPYANLYTGIVTSPNANSRMSDTMYTFTYGPCGPIETVLLVAGGNNFTSIPTMSVSSNNRIRELGILGRMDIVDGGVNYAPNNKIEFINIPGGSGVGAYANVRNVDANGTITRVEWLTTPGFYTGGLGYSQSYLPTANVITSTGSGANVVVTSIIGDGEILTPTTGTIGQILEVSLLSKGEGYVTAPTINMSSYGDGTANLTANIVAGVFSYPGRFLNDDGHLSASNYLQNRDYYQNYSYVIRVKDSLEHYRYALMSLIHPAGMKVFGEYVSTRTLTNTTINICNAAVVSTNTSFAATSYGTTYNVAGQAVTLTVA